MVGLPFVVTRRNWVTGQLCLNSIAKGRKHLQYLCCLEEACRIICISNGDMHSVNYHRSDETVYFSSNPRSRSQVIYGKILFSFRRKFKVFLAVKGKKREKAHVHNC